METPLFEDVDPAGDCDCPGCRHWRRVLPHAPAGRGLAHPAAHRALIVATAAASALGAGASVAVPAAAHAPERPGAERHAPEPPGAPAADGPGTPQGPRAPLHGPAAPPAPTSAGTKAAALTRTEIVERAKTWVAAKVPYSVTSYWSDGYRQDCSGFVSMAWKLSANEWTGSLAGLAERITKEELQPGDILLFHNASDPEKGSHVVIFGGWTDAAHTVYTAYEQTPPHTRKRDTPYAYWTDSAKFLPYRYTGVTAGKAASPAAGGPASQTVASHGVAGYPGRAMFRPGTENPYVTRLGRQLVRKGFGTHYTKGPGPRWGEADRRGVEAFQRAQGWRGGAADGYPGPETWRRLFS
ncbi:peptidoglycan-binding protein [Streptomyces olivaceus]|uniref:peptidoglycan-binding protein n=1 Tax=Streptomyces olivaceus TaxID=47716 RepID=UPI0033A9CADA